MKSVGSRRTMAQRCTSFWSKERRTRSTLRNGEVLMPKARSLGGARQVDCGLKMRAKAQRAATDRLGLGEDGFRRLSERSYRQAARAGIHGNGHSHRCRINSQTVVITQVCRRLTSNRRMAEAAHVRTGTASVTFFGNAHSGMFESGRCLHRRTSAACMGQHSERAEDEGDRQKEGLDQMQEDGDRTVHTANI